MDAKQLISEYNEGRRDFSNADLRGADLREANLREADLRGANLSGATLRAADLREANLRGADLRAADLREANLRGADLREADLSGADLSEADLSGAIGRFATGSFGKHTAIAACGYVSIGCERYTFAYWLENYETIGKANAYTAHEIARYGAWIRLVVEWLGMEKQGDD